MGAGGVVGSRMRAGGCEGSSWLRLRCTGVMHDQRERWTAIIRQYCNMIYADGFGEQGWKRKVVFVTVPIGWVPAANMCFPAPAW